MFMRYILIILLSLGIVCVKAQSGDVPDSTKRVYKNTISVNGSVFLEKLFKSNLVPDLNNPFLYYQRDFNKFFVRVGVNGWNSQKSEKNVKTSEITQRNNFYSSGSLGCYLTKNIGKKFSVAYGLNFMAGYVDSSVTFITNVDEVKNYSISKHMGVAPGVLLKYKITNRISVFAEYTMPIKKVVTVTGTKYSLFPEENTTDRETSGMTLLFYNPLNIYLSCSF